MFSLIRESAECEPTENLEHVVFAILIFRGCQVYGAQRVIGAYRVNCTLNLTHTQLHSQITVSAPFQFSTAANIEPYNDKLMLFLKTSLCGRDNGYEGMFPYFSRGFVFVHAAQMCRSITRTHCTTV